MFSALVNNFILLDFCYVSIANILAGLRENQKGDQEEKVL